MKRLARAIVIALIATTIRAQAPASDSADLKALLNEFLAGASRNDAAIHDRFWAEDLIYTGSSGRRIGKADIMKDVRSAPAPKPGDPSTTFTAEDVRVQQYGDVAVVAFQLVGTMKSGAVTETSRYLNSGTFLKRSGEWRAVTWQATKIPVEKPATTSSAVTQSGELPPELDRILRDYERAWQARDAEALSRLFAEDGFVLSSGKPPVRGRAAIREAYAKSGGPLILRSLSWSTEGRVGYIIGAFRTAQNEPDMGKFILAIRREDDGPWLIAADMDNMNTRPQRAPLTPSPN